MVKLLPIILRKPLSTSFEQRLLPKLSRTQQLQQKSQTMDLDEGFTWLKILTVETRTR